MRYPSAFETPEGEAAFLAAYDAVMKRWPVPFEEFDIPTQFGSTHVVATGPKGATPLVLLHGYMATSASWAPNVAAFSKEHRIYAVDVLGQPGKSISDAPIRDTEDYVAWLTTTLNRLRLDRCTLIGTSFGGWLALQYAGHAPERVQKLVLLSPGGLLPMARLFIVRGMLMEYLPTRFTVNSFMRWAGFSDRAGENDARPLLELMYLGVRHFRMPPETSRVAAHAAAPLSDDELGTLRMPVLLLMGEREVICDGAQAVARARRLIPDCEGVLIPGCSHDMCLSQRRIVDARVLDFLAGDGRAVPQRVVA